MMLWTMRYMAIQDVWVIVKISDKMWSPGEGNGKLLQYSCPKNPMNSMKGLAKSWTQLSNWTATTNIFSWPKSWFRCFHKMVWKNPKQLFGQPNNCIQDPHVGRASYCIKIRHTNLFLHVLWWSDCWPGDTGHHSLIPSFKVSHLHFIKWLHAYDYCLNNLLYDEWQNGNFKNSTSPSPSFS